MFFALGVLATGLLVLLIGPAVWRRAVRLTRRAVEATTPMSLAEVRAAHDQLRAEYAVETRRLELTRTALSDKVVRQQVAIADNREATKSLTLDRDAKLKLIAEAKSREEALRDELRRKEEDLERISARMRETERDLKRRSQQFVELSQKLGREAGIAVADQMNGEFPDIAELESQIATQKARQTADAARILALESELSALRRKYAALEDARAGMTTAPIAGRSPTATETVVQKLEGMVIDLEGQNVESQAEIARLSLQLEAMQGSNGDNMEGALISLEAENTALAEELNRTAVERGRLESQLKKQAHSQKFENRQLREQITDLAAQIVAMTAANEGEGSPINTILAQDAAAKVEMKPAAEVPGISAGAPQARRNGGLANSAATANRPSAQSLADRIRGLRTDGKSDAKPAAPQHLR